MKNDVKITEKDEGRFFSKIDVLSEDECWNWQGYCHPNGYGRFSLHGETQYAHRVAWMMANGKIGDKHVLHHCDNPPCVNPNHLWLGTIADNMHDRDKKGRDGNRCGEKHWNSRLTEKDVLEIREMAGKLSYRKIGEIYLVSKDNIKKIIKKKIWNHI